MHGDRTRAHTGDTEKRAAIPDTLNQSGAFALAKHGHAQGYPAVRSCTEPVGERIAKVGTYERYRDVCNLVGGLSPRYQP